MLREEIECDFENDQSQIKVLKSQEKRIIVEAPPGYGKTKLLLGKTVYDLLDNVPINHEKILMLTFSNNSTSKMRADLYAKLENHAYSLRNWINSKIRITNYHGLAGGILRKYGFLLDERLKDLKDIQIVNENHLKSIDNFNTLIKFKQFVDNALPDKLFSNVRNYNEVILNEVLPLNKLTYNSIITLTLQLLEDKPILLDLYKKIYTKIIIDEFQDTNHLNLRLLELFLHDDIRVELYGDPLQRIYGFIGTVGNLFDVFGEKYNFNYYTLKSNYRFKGNKFLIDLERRVRSYANDPINAYNNIKSYSHQNITIFENQQLESENVIRIIKEIHQLYPDKKTAILTSQRGPDINVIKEKLRSNYIAYFDALEINTESNEYRRFCDKCVESFQMYFSSRKNIVKKELNEWISVFKSSFELSSTQQQNLITLLVAMLQDVVRNRNYRMLNKDEKYDYILSVFLEYDLHRYLSAVDVSVQLLTIHTSKGLEWDNIFLVDIEKDRLPSYYGMCSNCSFKSNCNIEDIRGNSDNFIEQLSVFYVAITRARQNAYLSLSKKNAMCFDTNVSCILNELKIVPIPSFLT